MRPSDTKSGVALFGYPSEPRVYPETPLVDPLETRSRFSRVMNWYQRLTDVKKTIVLVVLSLVITVPLSIIAMNATKTVRNPEEMVYGGVCNPENDDSRCEPEDKENKPYVYLFAVGDETKKLKSKGRIEKLVDVQKGTKFEVSYWGNWIQDIRKKDDVN